MYAVGGDEPYIVVIENLHEMTSEDEYWNDISSIISAHRGRDCMDRFVKELSDIPAKLIIVVVNGHAVSMARVIYFPDKLYINAVHTLENHRRRGYARMVMQKIIEMADRKVELETDNPAAVKLYESVGFRITKEELITHMEYN